ncbi:MAG: hypothetical protein MZW92_14395 [Comamonadaceae bacterium]|nr:hypothetical protein [Comamonadaceae bacterium]
MGVFAMRGRAADGRRCTTVGVNGRLDAAACSRRRALQGGRAGGRSLRQAPTLPWLRADELPEP